MSFETPWDDDDDGQADERTDAVAGAVFLVLAVLAIVVGVVAVFLS